MKKLLCLTLILTFTLVPAIAEPSIKVVLDGEQVRRIVAGMPIEEPKSTPPTAPATHEEEPGRRAKERPSLVPPLTDPLPQE